MIIASERLDLIPMSLGFLRASLQCDIAAAQSLLRAAIPDDWPTNPAILAMRLRQLEEDPALEPWLLRAMVLRSSRTMIGHIGFHTAPGADYLQPYSPGAVEFGFTVFTAFQRQGYAREACLALMRWAQAAKGVQNFVLTIRPDNTASQALAAQLGFVRIGSHEDDVDGIEDILELKSQANAV